MNNEYKDCQYYFDGRCRCMDFSFNQDFYECPQCEDVSYCYYKQLKECEQKLEKIKEITETALKANYCNNCDGISILDCGDYECRTYALDEIMNVIEGAEDE